MKKLLIGLLLAAPLVAQIDVSQLSRAPRSYFGVGAPGVIPGNQAGDLYFDKPDNNVYACIAAPPSPGFNALPLSSLYFATPGCTTVATGNWVCITCASPTGIQPPSLGGTGIANTATLKLGTANQDWSVLMTGLVKNTSGGALSIGSGTDVTALFGGSPSISTPLYGDGNVYANPISAGVVGTDSNGHLIVSSASGVGTVTVALSGSLASGCPVIGAGTTVIQCSTLNSNGGGLFWPASDSTAAWAFDKADGVTGLFAIDSTNSRSLFASGSTSFPGIAGISYTTTGFSWASAIQLNIIHQGVVTASLASNEWVTPGTLNVGNVSDTPVTRNAAGTIGMPNIAIGTNAAAVGIADFAGPANFAPIPTPSAPVAGPVTSGGSCTAGSHTWEVTFLNAAGETLPSAASSIKTCVTSTGQTVPLSSIPLGPKGTTARNIYATKAGNTGSYYLIATSPVIADNTTTTYSFTIADGSFTATTAPTSNTTAIGVLQVAGTTVETLTQAGAITNAVTGNALTQTVASGATAMGTSAISSGSCATVITVAAANILTTDVIKAGFSGDPTGVTGYGVSSTGAVLSVYPYVTSGNANFKVCNSTATPSITPGAMTLNWQVTR
jgi:hypothetical protein